MAKRRKAGWLVPLACVVLVVVALFGGYLGAYYAMLEGDRLVTTFGQRWPPTWWRYDKFTVEPIYREDSAFTYALFWPAHQLDRAFRPNRWPFYGALELPRTVTCGQVSSMTFGRWHDHLHRC